jgi:hypothetical protein
MALLGHPTCTEECPLSGVKRTSLIGWPMSANDPKRTSPVGGHLTPMRFYEEERRLRRFCLGREKAAKFRRISCKLTPAQAGRQVRTVERKGSTMIVGFLVAVSWLNNDRPHAVWRIIARASMMGDRQS